MKIADFFYTQTQAAQALGVDRTTIWKWSKEGKIDIQRVGREVLIPKWEIELLKVRARMTRKRNSKSVKI